METAHDVFISYSSRDRARANAVCDALERDGIRCWIAPRDAAPGGSYASALVDAIAQCRAVVLLFSQTANDSEAVLNELELAANRAIPVLPLRLEPIDPRGAAEFYLRRRHWLDVFDDFERALPTLAPAVRSLFAQRTAVQEPQAEIARHDRLPRRPTSFVGRERELVELTGFAAATPLLTISGPGGVGKTRIALHVAAGLAAGRDGAWFVDLAPLTAPGLVATTIMATIGAAQHAPAEPLAQLLDVLRERADLLVIDNCEHLVAEAAHVLGAIVEHCPRVTLIATSREALKVSGERVFRLDPLNSESAVRLFCERARAANPLFVLKPENAPTVEAICTRLDGLALAIELAAARVRVISIDELARRLNERFRVLTGGNRGALPHQQTLRGLIDWSYDTLSTTERALFRRMAAFSGSFTLDALTDVAAYAPLDDWDALDVLTSLVDKSLVIADVDDREQRYRLLQSIHEYAAERLAELGEGSETSRRHALFFGAFSRRSYAEWDAAPGADWLARTRAERDNIRAALSWCFTQRGDRELGAQLAADTVPLYLRTALLGEGLTWCQTALALPDLAPLTAAQLHYGLSMLYNNRAAIGAALEHVERAVELYRSAGERRPLIRALSQHAQQTARSGRPEAAIAPATEAIAGARALGDRRLLAATLQRCALSLGPPNIERAREQFAESARLFRSLGRDDETARALEWWATAEGHAGAFTRAIALAREAVTYDPSDAARLHGQNIIASSALAIDDLASAAPAVRDAFALAQAAHHPILLAYATGYVAALCRDNDPELAAQLFGYSEAQLAALGATPDVSDTLRIQRLDAVLRERLGDARMRELRAEGALWDEARALVHAGCI